MGCQPGEEGADGLCLSLFQRSIRSCLCTSPIPTEESLESTTQPSHGQVALRRRRQRRRKPRRKEVTGPAPGGCEEPRGEVSVSFTDLPKEETGSLQAQEAHPYSDGELASMDR